MQVSSDEEEPCVPAFDRSTKPAKVAPSSDLHQRDFQPVWGDVVSHIHYHIRIETSCKDFGLIGQIWSNFKPLCMAKCDLEGVHSLCETFRREAMFTASIT